MKLKLVLAMLLAFVLAQPVMGAEKKATQSKAKSQQITQTPEDSKMLKLTEAMKDASVHQADAAKQQVRYAKHQRNVLIASLALVILGWGVQVLSDWRRNRAEIEIFLISIQHELDRFADPYKGYFEIFTLETIKRGGTPVIDPGMELIIYPVIAKNIGKFKSQKLRKSIQSVYDTVFDLKNAVKANNTVTSVYKEHPKRDEIIKLQGEWVVRSYESLVSKISLFKIAAKEAKYILES